MDDRRQRFEAQVLPHLDAAYRFARWLSRSPGDADDVVQEAVSRVSRVRRPSRIRRQSLAADHREKLPFDCGEAAAAARFCRPSRRSLRGRSSHDCDDARSGDLVDPPGRGPNARSADVTLPEEHREILVLREIEELDYREIAAVANIPIGTVMSRLARARAALKTRWLHETQGNIFMVGQQAVEVNDISLVHPLHDSGLEFGVCNSKLVTARLKQVLFDCQLRTINFLP